MKTGLKELIKSNYPNLTDNEIEKLVVKMQAVLPYKKIKLSELEAGKKFTYKGYEFTKLADEDNSCYCLLNDSVFESEFGETNDWAKSPIRKRLNEFDAKGNNKVLPNINANELVSVSLNYYAYKVPNGRTTDKITLPSWEEYIAYNFKPINKTAWLRSGGTYGAHRAYLLSSSGGYFYNNTTNSCAVRPALHLKSDIGVEP
ncbi:MAG: hypothetical protein NC131_00960 [Roseburia sp.]|nr:hypothetical protein [Roseburia sp.]